MNSSTNYPIIFFTIGVIAIFLLYLNPIFGQTNTSSHNNNDITYVSKFVCGSISGGEGPLRPGHYDTNIGITNKQLSKIPFLWNVSVNDGITSHSTLISLDHQKSTGLDCGDIKKVIGQTNSTSFVNGFVFITIPQDYNPSNPSNVIQYSSADINLLEVQAFFTANALDTLPHEIILEKISFYVINDETNQIPKHLLKTVLDVTLESKLNVIDDTEYKIKTILSSTYGISEKDYDKINLRIKNVSVGVGSMIDDHAVSLSIIQPQVNPSNPN